MSFTTEPGHYRGPTEIGIEDGGGTTASVRYTIDGSAPTATHGTIYAGPFEIFESLVVRAVAVSAAGVASVLTEARYEIEQLPLDPPWTDVEPGAHAAPLAVTLESGEDDAEIRYTLDGSLPGRSNGEVYHGPLSLTEDVVLRAVVTRRGFVDSAPIAKRYRVFARAEEWNEPIVLSGQDVLEIDNTLVRHRGPIELSGDATLLIRDSILQHVKGWSFQYQLVARDRARVIVERSGIGTVCTGSFNWAFFDESSLVVRGVDTFGSGCNTWTFMSGRASIDIEGWDGFGGTVCDASRVRIDNSARMELELCFPTGSRVDTALPAEIDEFRLSGDARNSIEFSLDVTRSSIEGWGVGLPVEGDITIRDTPAVTVSIVVGVPWRNRTVVIEGLRRGHWDDQTWEVGDSRLRLVNTYTYGWEPNVWADNTLIIRDSDYSASSVNGGDGHYIIERSRVGELVASERVLMEVRDSVVTGNVAANDSSRIVLVNSRVGEGDDAGGNVFARGAAVVELEGTTVQGRTATEGGGQIIVR